MKEVIYYRCEYCDKDFGDKDACSRHEKAEAKKYKNIGAILSLRKRDLKDGTLYTKFFDGDMSDNVFNVCPGDIPTSTSLSHISQKSLNSYGKKISEYEEYNSDHEYELCSVTISRSGIDFYFKGSMNPLESYEDSFKISSDVNFYASIATRQGLKIQFSLVKDTILYNTIIKKLYKIVAETKLVCDKEPVYYIDFLTRTVTSYNTYPNRSGASIIKERKFELL